jgi:hypothetical protein
VASGTPEPVPFHDETGEQRVGGEAVAPGAFVAGGMREPLGTVPERRAGTLRRTMHVDIGPRAAWGSALSLTGAARDLRTGPGGPGDVAVVAEAAVASEFDEGRRLVSLTTRPDAPWTGELLGARAGGGFRRLLDAADPGDGGPSLLRQVLDDLPAAALISGYAWMRLQRRAGHHPSELMPVAALERMTDLCAGWRRDGIAVRAVGSGGGVPVQDTPPAPVLGAGDEMAWHALDPLPPDWMRRRRLIDAERDGNEGFAVWAMFRDTVGEPGGGEVVLHEYAVHVEGSGRRITALWAEPRVLPFPECRGAADAVAALRGRDVGTLADAVPDVLVGVASCTHLNDLLRSLAGVDALLDELASG